MKSSFVAAASCLAIVMAGLASTAAAQVAVTIYNNDLALVQEAVGHRDGLIEQAARIIAQVDDIALQLGADLGLQLVDQREGLAFGHLDVEFRGRRGIRQIFQNRVAVGGARQQRLGERLARLGRPTVFTLEGGYAVAEVGVNVVNVLQGFTDTAP